MYEAKFNNLYKTKLKFSYFIEITRIILNSLLLKALKLLQLFKEEKIEQRFYKKTAKYHIV